jgi:protein TonB
MAGVYAVDGQSGSASIDSLGGNKARINGGNWEAVGWFHDRAFDGAWRGLLPGLEASARPHVGLVHLDAEPGGILSVTLRNSASTPVRTERWRLSADHLPKFGEFVFVEKLPENLSKSECEIPDEARKHHVHGQVVLQVLVGKDGYVKDGRVERSIPELDAAALACVRTWRFAPAMNKDQPVAVWIAVLVKFTPK